jgi:hypothetical protein
VFHNRTKSAAGFLQALPNSQSHASPSETGDWKVARTGRLENLPDIHNAIPFTPALPFAKSSAHF